MWESGTSDGSKTKGKDPCSRNAEGRGEKKRRLASQTYMGTAKKLYAKKREGEGIGDHLRGKRELDSDSGG